MSLSSDLELLLGHAASAQALDLPLVQRIARWLEECTPADQRGALARLEAVAEKVTAGSQDIGHVVWHAVLKSLVTQIRTRMPATDEPALSRAELLVAAVNAKMHVAEILRLLALKPARPTDLKNDLALYDQQVHRVLDWAELQGLLERAESEGSILYRLTPLGRRVIELFDSPPWLSVTAFLVRECARALIQGEPVDQQALRVSGLPTQQIEQVVAEISESIHPRSNSNLARALPSTAARPFVITPIVYSDELTEEALLKVRGSYGSVFVEQEGRYAPRLDVLGEGYIYQALERAGLSGPSFFDEWDPIALAAKYEHSDIPVHLDTTRPIISLSSPLVNPITLALLIRFGSPCYFEPNVGTYLRHERRLDSKTVVGPDLYLLDASHDHAIVLRFIEPDTDISHFVLAGFKPSGTHAACQFFYEKIEKLLAANEDTPFGAILRVPRGYNQRHGKWEVVAEFEIDSTPPSSAVDDIDLRFLEVLAVIADSYPTLLQQRPELAGEFSALATKARITNIEVGHLLDPTAGGQYTYERARALAIALQQDASFAETLILLLARIAGPQISPHIRALAQSAKEGFVNAVLADTLRLAPYSHRAVARVLAEKELSDRFIDICSESEIRTTTITEPRSDIGGV